MNDEKIKRHRELKKFENKLKTIYYRNLNFKRLYESNNKNENSDKDAKQIIISNDDRKDIFSTISDDTILFMDSIGEFNVNMFDANNNMLSVRNYYELLETVHCLINILEFELSKAYVKNNKLEKYYSVFNI